MAPLNLILQTLLPRVASLLVPPPPGVGGPTHLPTFPPVALSSACEHLGRTQHGLQHTITSPGQLAPQPRPRSAQGSALSWPLTSCS